MYLKILVLKNTKNNVLKYFSVKKYKKIVLKNFNNIVLKHDSAKNTKNSVLKNISVKKVLENR